MKKTKQQRRIEILKDAISQIKANKIRANAGQVVSLSYDLTNLDTSSNGNTEAKPILEKFFKDKELKNPCDACARGALLLCTVHKENDFILSDFSEVSGKFGEDNITDQRLLRLFSKTQLALMENAFECTDYITDYIHDDINEGFYDSWEENYSINYEILTKSQMRKSLEFGGKYEDENKRLIAIFRNAIKNGGIFKP